MANTKRYLAGEDIPALGIVTGDVVILEPGGSYPVRVISLHGASAVRTLQANTQALLPLGEPEVEKRRLRLVR